MISVIIPTYKSPEYLDLCLQSAVESQQNKNQIIVVVDGFYDLNKEVLDRWKDSIDILNLSTNQGLCRGTNLISSIPGYSTHVEGNMLSPTINWNQI
jgi:glycosyltransferase involved in cell wall biosynthesis